MTTDTRFLPLLADRTLESGAETYGLLASIFGMNVTLPGQPGSQTEFLVIIGIMLVTLLGVLLFFRRRGYL